MMPRADRLLELLQRYHRIPAVLGVALHTEALRDAVVAGGDEAHTTSCLTHVLH